MSFLRELLRFGSTALFCSAAIPISQITPVYSAPLPPKPHIPKVEVHFTGKHAFARILDKAAAERWNQLAMGDLVGKVGTFLLDTPYVGHTLDHAADKECCIVNLQELDCVTFVEATVGMSRVIKSNNNDPKALAKQIESLRYRNGTCNGFCSRLHYLTDWFYDNARRGLIKPYTQELPGAVSTEKKVALMSARPKQYLQLRKHPELIPEIKKDESAISTRSYYYLPKDKVKSAEQYMQTGDIIAITTEAKILDCAHTGLCYRDDKGVLHFLHASSDHHKVYLDTELSEYLNKVYAFTGVMVAHPLEPKLDAL